MSHYYLSGPMDGIPGFNIAAFDKAADSLRARDHEVISPAELDDPAYRDLCLLCKKGSMEELEDLCYAAKARVDTRGNLLGRDIKLLIDEKIDAIVVLPGWEGSDGARLETFAGRVHNIPILAYPSLNPIEQYHLEYVHALPAPGIIEPRIPERWIPVDTAESVQADAEIPEGPIKRALPLVHRNRQDAYGHPSEDFARTAGMWKAMFGWNVQAKDVPLAMIAVKLSRLRQSPEHEDSATDIAGYIETYEMTLKGNHDS